MIQAGGWRLSACSIGAVAFLVAGVTVAEGSSHTITLDYTTGVVTPGEPTININARPSIVVEVMPADQIFRICPNTCEPNALQDAVTRAERELHALGLADDRLRSLVSQIRDVAAAPAARALDPAGPEIQALPDKVQGEVGKILGEVEQQRKAASAAQKTIVTGNRTAVNFEAKKGEEGIGIIPLGPNLWTVTYYGPKRSRDFVIDVECTEAAKCPGGARHRVIAVHIDSSQFDLRWSMGIAASGLRDDRVRFDPIPGDSENQSLTVTGEGPVPYVLGAFAHYCPVKDGIQWLCPSAGFGLDIPVSGLQVMVGPAIRVRPLTSDDAGFLFFGVAYGPRKELADRFIGLEQPTVKIGTTPENVLSTKYKTSWVVGISFGFFGGEEKFKGVYSGIGKGEAGEK
jgi:hypothetical protein